MKKKTILCLTSFALILIIIAGGVMLSMWNKDKTTPKEPQKESQSGTLVVNNGDAVTENVVIHFKENANYADLPLTEVMKSLGITVDWIDSDIAEISYNDKKYVLNLAEVSLVENGKDYSFIIPAQGSTNFHYKVLEKELVLDDVTVRSIIYTIKKIHINIDINHDKLIVYITERIN